MPDLANFYGVKMLPGLAVDCKKEQQTMIFRMRSEQSRKPVDAANKTTQDLNLKN